MPELSYIIYQLLFWELPAWSLVFVATALLLLLLLCHQLQPLSPLQSLHHPPTYPYPHLPEYCFCLFHHRLFHLLLALEEQVYMGDRVCPLCDELWTPQDSLQNINSAIMCMCSLYEELASHPLLSHHQEILCNMHMFVPTQPYIVRLSQLFIGQCPHIQLALTYMYECYLSKIDITT